MRHRYIGGALLAAAAMLAGPSIGRAQNITGTGPFTDGADGGFPLPVNSEPPFRTPWGGREMPDSIPPSSSSCSPKRGRSVIRPSPGAGSSTRTGRSPGRPGRSWVRERRPFKPATFSPRTYQPGFNVELGYRFDDGTRIFANYMQLVDAHYSIGASLVPQGFGGPANLSATFLTTPVFNFNVAFGGPAFKSSLGDAFALYGIWNGASQMDMKFTQRYQEMNVGARVPLLQTEQSRVYGMAGGRFAWFFERFAWRAVSYDESGNTQPLFAADYTNTLSQRMYGPFIGCGHEIFAGNQFSCSLDLTGSILMDVAKQRAKYEIGDETVQSKWGREEFKMVPNANAAINLWWYPLPGVQIRAGYQAMTYFNTLYMLEPVGINYGNINPSYQTRYFRLIHGFNVGIGFFF